MLYEYYKLRLITSSSLSCRSLLVLCLVLVVLPLFIVALWLLCCACCFSFVSVLCPVHSPDQGCDIQHEAGLAQKHSLFHRHMHER